jgi:cytochrome c biogenesis protein CcdA/thiol-disulfide isomerase/thioredoxin
MIKLKFIAVFVVLLLLITPLVFAKSDCESDGKVCIYFFHSKSCLHCEKANSYIAGLEKEYPIEVHGFEISENSELINKLYKNYGVPNDERGRIPIVFIGGTYFLGDTPIIENLESKIQECIEINCTKCPLCEECAEEEISLAYVLGLALVDAVNPCELAVLIILMTAILTRFPTEKRKALNAGLAFSAAIFLMYFIFGLLIIYGFKFLAVFDTSGGVWFFKLLGILAIILGLLNIKDAIWYGGGGFIMEVPQRWRPTMIKLIKGATSTKGAFFVGLIVSFFLTPCTAGPYFVVNGLLSSLESLSAAPYLLIYMCIFISPMIAITLIAYSGFKTVEDMGGWRERNLKNLHWVAGLILLGLGIAMVLGLI